MRVDFLFSSCRLLIVLFVMLAAALPAHGLEIERLADRAVVYHPVGASGNVLAISTGAELVLVDTGMSPEIAVEVTRALREDFGDLSVRYVINTHSHWDHVQGNQGFPDALFIGHEACRQSMMAAAARARDRAQAASAGNAAPAPQAPPRQSEGVTGGPAPAGDMAPPPAGDLPPPPPSLILIDGVRGYVSTPPELTFDNRLDLHLGGLTFSLIHFGQAHSSGDILVHVPELGLLAVGDLFLPGTLPTFLAKTPWHDEQWLAALDAVLMADTPLRHIVPGHRRAMDRQQLVDQVGYIRGLRAEVTRQQAAGATLEQFLGEFDLDRSFPALAGFDLTGNQGGSLNQGILEAAWRTVLAES